MRIVVVEFAGRGGMIHYAYQLCRAMANRGAEVTLITADTYELAGLSHNFRVEPIIRLWDPKPAGELSMAPRAIIGRKLRRLGRAARYYAEWRRVIRRAAEIDPDVILFGDVRFPSDLIPLAILRRNGRLFADICHNIHPFAAGGSSGGLFDRSAWRRFLYRRIYRLFDVVFVHFERNRREFMDSFKVAERKISVIVHGNERIFEELRSDTVDAAVLRRRLAIPDDERVVLFFGTLSRYKGTDVLLKAFAGIAPGLRARLVLAGYPFHDFNLAAHREMARQLGIASSVTWVPEYIASEEVAAWMDLAAVIVFPYRDIYQSGALHIAQTFGVPTVASAVGAMQDVVSHEQSGLLVPPEDRSALTEAISRLLTDEAFARRLGARAAADAAGPYSWESIAGTIVETFHSELD